ncbi:MAG: tetratricopeptide repeat protein, partial [Oligoflexales bacterium]|nr:tetratricopeptide repeat protein [Oligoflexales bacterium]
MVTKKKRKGVVPVDRHTEDDETEIHSDEAHGTDDEDDSEKPEDSHDSHETHGGDVDHHVSADSREGYDEQPESTGTTVQNEVPPDVDLKKREENVPDAPPDADLNKGEEKVFQEKGAEQQDVKADVPPPQEKIDKNILLKIAVDKELYSSFLLSKGLKKDLIMYYAQIVAEKLGILFGKVVNGYQSVFKIMVEDKIYIFEKRGNFHFKREQYDAAIPLYEEVLAHKPENFQVYERIGYCCLMTGKYDNAISFFDKAISHGKGSEDITFHLGLAYLKAGNDRKALSLFGELLEKYPDHVAAHFRIGIVHMNLGDFDDAIRSFEKALEICPGISLIHQNM